MKWVHQKHANGCGVATLAMILDEPYDDLITEIDEQNGHGHHGDWDKDGISHITLDRLLFSRGYFIQRHYNWDDNWPPKPWAPVHYAQVTQSSGNGHFIAMEEDGRVLDPMVKGYRKLSDWDLVSNVVGLLLR